MCKNKLFCCILHKCNPSTQEAEAGRSCVGATLGCVYLTVARPCVIKKFFCLFVWLFFFFLVGLEFELRTT
jgi:hypothetical protein